MILISFSVRALALQSVDYNENQFIDRENVGIVGVFEVGQGKCLAIMRLLQLDFGYFVACGLNKPIMLFDFEGVKAKRVCVATTHILFNPSRGMIKIAQLSMLLQKAKALVDSQGADIPISKVSSYRTAWHLYLFSVTDGSLTLPYIPVLCGDMNALPHSTVINYLTAGS